MLLLAMALVNLRESILYTLLCYTAEPQCVSRADFDSVVAQIAAIESAHSTWRNATLHILRRILPANPGEEQFCDEHRSLVVVALQ